MSAGAAAAALWALIWFLCTMENSRRLYEWDDGRDDGAAPGEGGYPFWTNGKQLAYWMSFWVRDQDENDLLTLVLWVQPEDRAAALLQIALTVALFGAAVGWAVRAVPPDRRAWPATLLSCWGLSIGAALVGAAVAAVFREAEEHQSRGEMIALFTGAGGPVPAVLGLPAAAVGTAVAWYVRARTGGARASRAAAGTTTGTTTAPPPRRADEGPLRVPVSWRASAWPTLALSAVLALVLLLSNARIIEWLLGEHGLHAREWLPFWLVSVVVPGYWSGPGAPEGVDFVLDGPSLTVALLTIAAQAALAAALFWPVVRWLSGLRLPELMLVGGSAGVLACLVVRPLGGIAGMADGEPALMAAAAGFVFAPGAFLTGVLGGVAAWAVGRRVPWAAVAQGPEDAVPECTGEPECVCGGSNTDGRRGRAAPACGAGASDSGDAELIVHLRR